MHGRQRPRAWTLASSRVYIEEQLNEQLNEQSSERGEKTMAAGGLGGAESDMPAALNTPAFCAVWHEHQKYRRQQKFRPLGEIARRRTLADMAKWGVDRAIAAIKFSESNGWQGIFEDKHNGTNGKFITQGDKYRADKRTKEYPENLKL